MMEIYGTIHFKLILPHFPGFQQEPLPAPVCSRSPECDGCPYKNSGTESLLCAAVCFIHCIKTLHAICSFALFK